MIIPDFHLQGIKFHLTLACLIQSTRGLTTGETRLFLYRPESLSLSPSLSPLDPAATLHHYPHWHTPEYANCSGLQRIRSP